VSEASWVTELTVAEPFIHTFHLDEPIDPAALVEWVSILTGGTVQGRTVMTATFVYEIAGSSVEIRRANQDWLCLETAFATIYTVWLGLSAFGVSGSGPWLSALPILEKGLPRIPFRRKFLDGREVGLSEQIALPVLGEINRALASKDFGAFEPHNNGESRSLLTHRSGLRIELNNDGHRILDRSPLSLPSGFWHRSFEVLSARTFGEAILVVSRPGGVWVTFEELPNEVAIVGDRSIGRFQIEDLKTLRDLDYLRLGEGCSTLFSQEQWVRLAAGLETWNLPRRAIDAWEQAGRLGEDSARQITRLQAVVAKMEESMQLDRLATVRKEALAQIVPELSLAELLRRLTPECQSYVQQVALEVEDAYADSHDYHQPMARISGPRTPAGSLSYQPLSTQDLLETGIHPAVMEYFPRQVDWFCLRCCDEVFWGDVGSRLLIWLGESSVVYRTC
jgi:hypothetical protein